MIADYQRGVAKLAINFGAEDGWSELITHYDLWRKISSSVGGDSYDEAEIQDHRLYLRSDYADKLKKWPDWAEFGDWGAWIITSTAEGYFCVWSSLKHERQAERDEDIKVLFSKLSDAGKYVIMRIGDGVRVDLRLQTQYVKWDDRGLDSHILVEPANQEAIAFLNTQCPTLREGFAEQYLKRYTFENHPGSYAFAFPEDQPRMEVLAMSFEELTAALLEGMPDSITSQVPRWRQ